MKTKLRVDGMTCDHCSRTVSRSLERLEGVTARVSFDDQQRVAETDERVSGNELLAAGAETGFSATSIESPERQEPDRDGPRLHVAVIGSGAASFAASIKAVEEGARVTMVEASTLGGTCVNVGCVPSKILLRGAHIAHQALAHPFDGLERRRLTVDRRAMVAQQQARIEELRGAKYEGILDSLPEIELVRGFAAFEDPHTLRIETASGETRQVRADFILVATGSSAWAPGIPGLEGTPYWTSTEALIAEQVPKHLLVLGGSLVAVELAQAYRRLGAEVTLLARSTLFSKGDPQLGAGLRETFEEEGIKVLLDTVPSKVNYNDGKFGLETEHGVITGDQLLVATGRRANTAKLDLEKAGVETTSTGAIVVDRGLRTNVPHIYAAGDCTTLPQFVYVAAAAGTRAAVNMMGGEAELALDTMPAVAFTDPQVAWVGLTESEAAEQGIRTESRTLSINNVPRALANFDSRGFIKIVAEAASGRMLGVQILAAEGGEIIQSAGLALRAGMTIEDLATQLFPYLTMVEGLKLCAQTFTKDVTQLSCCAG